MQSSSHLLPTAAATALDSSTVTREQDLRCAYYCEENVWRLAYRKLHQQMQGHETQEYYFVVIISNKQKTVLMFHQRASDSPDDAPCCWDYHVILIGVRVHKDTEEKIEQNKKSVVVYDVDTTLTPYPVPLSKYLRASFPDRVRSKTYAPLFRLIPADNYIRYFASDRSHMYNAATGKWKAPPPSYQCIIPTEDEIEKSIAPINTASYESDDAPKDEQQRECFTSVMSKKSNLMHYLNFEPVTEETATTLLADALGSILTLQQLRTHEF